MATDKTTLTPADKAVLGEAADALALIIRLHEREVDAAFLAGLGEAAVCDWLAALLESPESQAGVAALRAALGGLALPLADERLDALAADYADIYLTHGYRAAPTASVWLSEDHTERNEPMFEARNWYEHWGITVPDWRMRADDHIVHELQFVEHLCRTGSPAAAIDAGLFIDRQMQPWVPGFLTRVGARAQEPLYQAAAVLTLALLEELREALEAATGVPRERPESETRRKGVPDPKTRTKTAPEAEAYVPGLAPSW